MTKKEIIINAWIALGIKTPFGICDNTGYYHGYFCNGVDDIEAEYGAKIIDLINYDIDMSGIGKFRPKSLQGIENNNGWANINSTNDLPNMGYYEVIRRDTGKPERSTLDNDFGAKIAVEIYSHWKPISEIELPIF